MKTYVKSRIRLALVSSLPMLSAVQEARALTDEGGRPDARYLVSNLAVPFADATPLTGDFTGDGRGDVLWYTPGTPTVGTPDDELWAGTATIGAFTKSALASAQLPALAERSSPVAGDFNGDGLTDIFWYDQQGQATDEGVSLRSRTGTGALIWVSQRNSPRSAAGASAKAADFNGDGMCDVLLYWSAFQGGAGLATIRWGAATAPLQTYTFVTDASGNLLRPDAGSSVEVGDLDGDGKADVRIFSKLAVNPGDNPWLGAWYGRGDTKFDFAVDWRQGAPMQETAFVGDSDGDGYGDVLLRDSSTGLVSSAYGGPRVTFALDPNGLVLGTPGARYLPVCADFNGDGRRDVLWYGKGSAADSLWTGRRGFRYTRDVDIGLAFTRADGAVRRLKVDVVRPSADRAGPYPTVVFVHGGGWHSTAGSQHVQAPYFPDAALLRAGYALVSVDYRGVEERGTGTLNDQESGASPGFVEMVKDVKYTLAWLRANGAGYGLKTDLLTLMGHSAGGHLTAMAGLTNGLEAFQPILPTLLAGNDRFAATRVDGIVTLAAPVDAALTRYLDPKDNLWKDSALYHTCVGGLLGCNPVAGDYTLANDPATTADDVVLHPCHVLFNVAFNPTFQADRTDPPVLLIHAKDDFAVPSGNADQLMSGLRAMRSSDVLYAPATGGHLPSVPWSTVLKPFLARTVGTPR